MLTYVVALFALLWLVGFALGFVYRARLRAVSAEIAAELVPWQDASKSWKGMRFLIGGGFRAVQDAAFVRFCEVYRAVILSMWPLLVLLPFAFVSDA
jgi:hypothetical protein